MTNVITLPNQSDRFWNLVRAEIVIRLKEAGIHSEVAEKVATETESYHRLIYQGPVLGFALSDNLDLTPKQVSMIQAQLDDLAERVQSAISQYHHDIQAAIVGLLVEKYAGR